MNTPDPLPQMDRRTAIRWMLTATATITVLEPAAMSADGADRGAASTALKAKGYGPDPNMVAIYKPGDLWPLTFTAAQRRTAGTLCDVMIPADETSPSASSVGVTDFIDEWISSPYPAQAGDRRIVLEGLAWIDEEAKRRFNVGFSELNLGQQKAICDDINNPAKAKPERKSAVTFFKRFRDLTAGGYYTTPQGMKDIGYIGNVALAEFPGPPIEALRHVGLA